MCIDLFLSKIIRYDIVQNDVCSLIKQETYNIILTLNSDYTLIEMYKHDLTESTLNQLIILIKRRNTQHS